MARLCLSRSARELPPLHFAYWAAQVSNPLGWKFISGLGTAMGLASTMFGSLSSAVILKSGGTVG